MNKRMEEITPFIVMDVLDKAGEMEKNGVNDVIHMEVGEPDFNIPQCAMEATVEAVRTGQTHYTNSLGDVELREEIANFYKSEYGVTLDLNQIVITSGSSPAILMAMMLVANENDEIIVSNPGYSCYRNFATAVGAKTVEYPISAEEGYQYDVERLRTYITDRTAAIVINSPMNPTGTLLRPDVMECLARLGVPIISDEIYHGLVYGNERAHTILEYTDESFVLNGFSKRFAMTGMRLGFLIFPKRYIRTVTNMNQNLFICAPSISQKAGLAALRGATVEINAMRETYDERRRFLLHRLNEIGLKVVAEPQGAFYVFADVRDFTDDCYKFAFSILEHCHVGVTPGVDFGSMGEGYIRFSYANSLDNIAEAMNRIERYLKKK